MPKKWDYPYWGEKFRNARDEELCDLHKEFMTEAGYVIPPLKIWNTQDEAPIIPKIGHNKDEVVKRLLLEKADRGSLLVVGFMNTPFIFNLGLGEGFDVDGIDVNDDHVDAAKSSLTQLPPELANKFNFHHMLAENLTGLPKYDFTSNFCLEHTRDPEQVIAENLKHLKEGGHAYFTPPIGIGTDSPNHLHHFSDEAELLALLPDEYAANIFRVKFNYNSPRDNCFVMEVYNERGG